jgi:hypothetical protein
MKTNARQFTSKFPIETCKNEEIHLNTTMKIAARPRRTYGTVEENEKIRYVITDVEEWMVSIVEIDII